MKNPGPEVRHSDQENLGTKDAFLRVMICSTGCLCLVVVVLGTFLALMLGKITPEVLGRVSSVGAGGGLLGLALVIYWTLKLTLQGPR